MSHVTYMCESWSIYECFIEHFWTSHWNIYEWVMQNIKLIRMSHRACVNESWKINQWVMVHIIDWTYITRIWVVRADSQEFAGHPIVRWRESIEKIYIKRIFREYLGKVWRIYWHPIVRWERVLGEFWENIQRIFEECWENTLREYLENTQRILGEYWENILEQTWMSHGTYMALLREDYHEW